jgi:hypothetical protein
MQRFITALFATAITVATASAGTIAPITPSQVEIGGPNGLTATFIGSGTDGGSWAERNYNSKLFSNAKEGSTVPSATYTDSADGITFAPINDGTGAGGLTDNYWEACPAGLGPCTSPITMTIPIGIAAPLSVWTMLNNAWGTPGAQQTTVTFDFMNGSTPVPVTINLTNANNNGVTGGQIAASVDCSAPASTCTSYAGALGSALAGSSSITPVGGGTAVTVLTGTVYSFAYNSLSGGVYSGSSGTVYLDDQGFIFTGTPYASDYLVDVKITESSGLANVSQTALSAITVVTPEPSTIILVLAGFGAIGVSRLRRRSS